MKLETKTGKYVEKGDNQYHLTGFNRFRKMIGVELGIVGIPMFVLWLAPVFNLYHILTIYYCLFHVGSVVMIAAYYLRKCNKAGGGKILCKSSSEENADSEEGTGILQ